MPGIYWHSAAKQQLTAEISSRALFWSIFFIWLFKTVDNEQKNWVQYFYHIRKTELNGLQILIKSNLVSAYKPAKLCVCFVWYSTIKLVPRIKERRRDEDCHVIYPAWHLFPISDSYWLSRDLSFKLSQNMGKIY